MLYEVRAKSYRTIMNAADNTNGMPWYNWKIITIPGVLKLYRHEDSGATQLVLHTPMCGIVKLNLGI
jgi:hypothetical protein